MYGPDRAGQPVMCGAGQLLGLGAGQARVGGDHRERGVERAARRAAAAAAARPPPHLGRRRRPSSPSAAHLGRAPHGRRWRGPRTEPAALTATSAATVVPERQRPARGPDAALETAGHRACTCADAALRHVPPAPCAAAASSPRGPGPRSGRAASRHRGPDRRGRRRHHRHDPARAARPGSRGPVPPARPPRQRPRPGRSATAGEDHRLDCSTRLRGSSASVSRVPGAPPRTSTAVTAPPSGAAPPSSRSASRRPCAARGRRVAGHIGQRVRRARPSYSLTRSASFAQPESVSGCPCHPGGTRHGVLADRGLDGAGSSGVMTA